ncbi:Replication factor C small subunit [Methanosarcina lacustris Z-7289]|uniref:Replication factor C small subunit n=1 Tax=Methanosarcina lacustris Z-7289 TaxID=1434111 RepID=A0A0E3WRV7_9EURY|nr:replication factor C small subunit [Methanosarcina lacustris]AKB73705.1 Replication factor C small subunit [Methanosarcina lacustris Z-7289]
MEDSKIKDEIWIEKYRPVRLNQVAGQKETIERLMSYVATKNLPHLLFSGPPGVGKTASAVSIARELFGEELWRENFTELNASDERGIDVVRNKIKNFAKTAPIGGASFKIIFLDEADALTSDAQSALRRTMEKFSSNCRFILSCNYSSKIIEPIQSRCAVYRFRRLSDEAIKERLEYIAKDQELSITEGGYEALIYVAQGDMRKAVNSLQAAAFIDPEKPISRETIYRTTATANPDEIKNLIETALRGNFRIARKELNRLLYEEGLSGEDIVGQIYRVVSEMDNLMVLDLGLSERDIVALVDVIGETDFRLTEGASEKIQLEALLAHFALSREN